MRPLSSASAAAMSATRSTFGSVASSGTSSLCVSRRDVVAAAGGIAGKQHAVGDAAFRQQHQPERSGGSPFQGGTSEVRAAGACLVKRPGERQSPVSSMMSASAAAGPASLGAACARFPSACAPPRSGRVRRQPSRRRSSAAARSPGAAGACLVKRPGGAPVAGEQEDLGERRRHARILRRQIARRFDQLARLVEAAAVLRRQALLQIGVMHFRGSTIAWS